MREALVSIFGPDGAVVVQYVVTFLIILGLVGGAVWLGRRYTGSGINVAGRGRLPRLAVIDALTVDKRRRLVLVRRDNVEHLLLIGGPSDIVVEPTITRTRVAPRPGQATGDRPPAQPAVGAPQPAPPPPPNLRGTAAIAALRARALRSHAPAEPDAVEEPIPFPPRRAQTGQMETRQAETRQPETRHAETRPPERHQDEDHQPEPRQPEPRHAAIRHTGERHHREEPKMVAPPTAPHRPPRAPASFLDELDEPESLPYEPRRAAATPPAPPARHATPFQPESPAAGLSPLPVVRPLPSDEGGIDEVEEVEEIEAHDVLVAEVEAPHRKSAFAPPANAGHPIPGHAARETMPPPPGEEPKRPPPPAPRHTDDGDDAVTSLEKDMARLLGQISSTGSG